MPRALSLGFTLELDLVMEFMLLDRLHYMTHNIQNDNLRYHYINIYLFTNFVTDSADVAALFNSK